MNSTEQLAVREPDDVAAYRPIVEAAPHRSRSPHEEPAPAPGTHRFSWLQRLRQTMRTICEAGQPAPTPQAPLGLPNGAVTWTPYAVDHLHRTAVQDGDLR